MKQSLKQILNTLIEDRKGGVVSIQEIEFVCKQENKKLSNAERRLRQSESPNIERVFKNAAIIGYRAKQSDIVTQFFKDFPPKLKVRESNTLF